MYNWKKSVILDIYKSNRPRWAKGNQMFNPLTAAATILAAALVFEFVTGLVQLWNESAKAPTVAAAPIEADIWEGEVQEAEVSAAAPTFEFRCQLCLPAAPELSVLAAAYAEATLESQTIRQLKALAKERGLKKYSYLTKAELIAALM